MTLELALAVKSALVLAALAAFVVYERLHPVEDSPLFLRFGRAARAGWSRLIKNLGLFGFNLLLSPLIVIPITALSSEVTLGLRPDWWSGWFGLALDILILDLWIYAWHRANHEIQFLWRFHEVHHLDEFLDTSSALRFHFGEVALSAMARLPFIVLFDVPLASVILFEGLILSAAIFHHSDAALPPKLENALAKVIVTPSIHWVHHHALRADTDSNYGTIFSFWDRIFRSKSLTRRFRGMKIGVERLKDQPLHKLIVRPLRR